MKIVSMANQKGGAAKTTNAMNLAAVIAKNARVLVADTDPQQSATRWAAKAGDALPFDFASDTDPLNLGRLRELDYDVVIIDTPGNLTDSETLAACINVSDFVIVSMVPESLFVEPTKLTISHLIEPLNIPYRVLLSKVDMRVPGLLEDWKSALDDILHLPRFQQHIRQYKSISDSPLVGEVVTQFPDTRQTANAIFDYNAVVLELTSMWAHTAPRGI